mmetsp:Transcript_1779/g.6509  ORF Transcript_1779/g.6509 Transcript_1779/m.6509 type:complete len:268 (-) Transcript_1779:2081-2884(-)
MTCPFRSSTSFSFGCNDATSALCNTSLSLLPNSAKYGVMAMVSTTAKLSCVAISGLNKPTRTASANVTKANSPPGPMYIPARTQFNTDRPNNGPTAATTAILAVTIPIIMAMMLKALLVNVIGSIVIPTVMKNKPRRRPLNGAISFSTCKWNSVSAKSKPARKAPSAIDNPKDCVSNEVPRATNNVVALISSACRSLATRSNTGRKINRPRPMIAPMATPVLTIAFSNEPAIAVKLPLSGPAKSGTSMKTSTTVKSWKRSTENVARP